MRNLFLSTLLFASLSMQGQQAAYYKLSPFVREVATLARAELRQRPQLGNMEGRELSAFIRTEATPMNSFSAMVWSAWRVSDLPSISSPSPCAISGLCRLTDE